MNIYMNPTPEELPALLQRPGFDPGVLADLAEKIFDDIRANGDEAVSRYSREFDHFTADTFQVDDKTIQESGRQLSKPLKKAIKRAIKNVDTFHRSQREQAKKIKTSTGITCWRESRPIEKVGLYIPGGSAPLFSTLIMLAVPANIAGCPEIILCTPPSPDEQIHPAILYTAKKTGVKKIFAVGGMQAIAAMALGTESIPKVDKIFGPGNQYVTAAKLKAQLSGIAIDLPAGPSEVLVIADKTARPAFVAADLLSQAEHGPDSQVILVSHDKTLIQAVFKQIQQQVKKLPRRDTIRQSLQSSKAFYLDTLDDCVALSNLYAPEHLILAVKNPESLISSVTNAGSVFLGHYACESAGDYASGTNHTLPTHGFARSYGGVSLDSFVKKITFQKISRKGIQNLGPVITEMACAESLEAHANAVQVRLDSLFSKNRR